MPLFNLSPHWATWGQYRIGINGHAGLEITRIADEDIVLDIKDPPRDENRTGRACTTVFLYLICKQCSALRAGRAGRMQHGCSWASLGFRASEYWNIAQLLLGRAGRRREGLATARSRCETDAFSSFGNATVCESTF